MRNVLEYKISVIVPCYSVGPKFLNEALESIKQQTYKNWEIILVDDCSPKQEWKIEIVSNLIKDNKLKLINNQKNFGLAVSRNIGFDNSEGDIILFLDSDDKYSKNNFFEYLNQKFQEIPNLDLIYFEYLIFPSNKKKKKLDKKNKLKNEYLQKIKIQDFLATPKFALAAWVKAYKKSFLIKNNIRHLDKNTPHEDWVFWFQIFIKNPNIFLTNEKFVLYRQRKNSIMDKMTKIKNWDINSLKIAKNDIEEYINRGGYEANLNQLKIQFLSYSIFVLILKYGIKKCQKHLGINREILKQIICEQKKKGPLKTKIIINLKFIGRIIFWFYLLFKS